MGYGDEIMATGDARVVRETTGRRVAICKGKTVRWHAMFSGNPGLASQAEVDSDPAVIRIQNYPGARPYLDYDKITRLGRSKLGKKASFKHEIGAARRWIYVPGYRVARGEIFLTEQEKAWAAEVRKSLGPFVVFEPRVKARASPNKQWGARRWLDLVDLAEKSAQLVQLVPPGCGALLPSRAAEVVTPTFRHAAAVLSQASAAVLPEGGLHHAAAALGVPAVVIFGGCTAADVLGYSDHVNLSYDHPDSPCGLRDPCGHCREAMDSIKPGDVARHLKKLLEREDG